MSKYPVHNVYDVTRVSDGLKRTFDSLQDAMRVAQGESDVKLEWNRHKSNRNTYTAKQVNGRKNLYIAKGRKPGARRKNPARKNATGDHFYLQDQETGQFFFRGYPYGKTNPPRPYPSFESAAAAFRRLKKTAGNDWDLSTVKIVSVPVDLRRENPNPLKGNWHPAPPAAIAGLYDVANDYSRELVSEYDTLDAAKAAAQVKLNKIARGKDRKITWHETKSAEHPDTRVFHGFAFGGELVYEIRAWGRMDNPKRRGVFTKREVEMKNAWRENPTKGDNVNNQLWRAASDYVNKLDKANREQVEVALANVEMAASDYGLPASRREYYRIVTGMLKKVLKDFGPKRNPIGKKVMRKKKRSPAQLRNDKRLGAMAKKRGKKKATRKKVAKKTASKRRANPASKAKSHLWLVWRCKGNTVNFLTLPIWTADKGKAMFFTTKRAAQFALESVGNLGGERSIAGFTTGVASGDATAAQIRKVCGGK